MSKNQQESLETCIKRAMLLPVSNEISGDLVILRAYQNGDGAEVFEAVDKSRDHLEAFQSWQKKMLSVDDAEAAVQRLQGDWHLRTRLGWAIREHKSLNFLGHIQLEHINWQTPSFGIGYWLKADAQGKGYVSQATKLLVKLAFESLNAKRVHIETDARNFRSAAVAHRSGFTREGLLRNERRDSHGFLQDTLQFSMTPEEYEEAKSRWYR